MKRHILWLTVLLMLCNAANADKSIFPLRNSVIKEFYVGPDSTLRDASIFGQYVWAFHINAGTGQEELETWQVRDWLKGISLTRKHLITVGMCGGSQHPNVILGFEPYADQFAHWLDYNSITNYVLDENKPPVWSGPKNMTMDYMLKCIDAAKGKPVLASINLVGNSAQTTANDAQLERRIFLAYAAIGSGYRGLLWQGDTSLLKIRELTASLKQVSKDLGQARPVPWAKGRSDESVSSLLSGNVLFIILLSPYYTQAEAATAVPPGSYWSQVQVCMPKGNEIVKVVSLTGESPHLLSRGNPAEIGCAIGGSGTILVCQLRANATTAQEAIDTEDMDEKAHLIEAWKALYGGKAREAVEHAGKVVNDNAIMNSAYYCMARGYWLLGGNEDTAKARQLWASLANASKENSATVRSRCVEVPKALEIARTGDVNEVVTKLETMIAAAGDETMKAEMMVILASYLSVRAETESIMARFKDLNTANDLLSKAGQLLESRVARPPRPPPDIDAMLVGINPLKMALWKNYEKVRADHYDLSQGSEKNLIDVALDKTDKLWFTSRQQGLYECDLSLPAGERWQKSDQQEVSGGTTAIIIDTAGRLWVGCADGQVVSRSETGQWQAKKLGESPVVGFAASREEMVVATSTGVFICDKGFADWRQIDTSHIAAQDSYEITCVAIDANGRLYIGTSSRGIAILVSTKGNSWIAVPPPATLSVVPTGNGLASGCIRDILYTSNKMIYAATSMGLAWWSTAGDRNWKHIRGKNYLDVTKAMAARIKTNAKPPSHEVLEQLLAADDVRCLTEDGQGNLWIGYNQAGYQVMSLKTGRIIASSGDQRGSVTAFLMDKDRPIIVIDGRACLATPEPTGTNKVTGQTRRTKE